MSGTQCPRLWVYGPRVLPEKGIYLTEEVLRWCSLSTRSGPAETGRIVPRCENLPEGIWLVPQLIQRARPKGWPSIRLPI